MLRSRYFGSHKMSNRWKANLLTALIIAVLLIALAHSYGFI